MKSRQLRNGINMHQPTRVTENSEVTIIGDIYTCAHRVDGQIKVNRPVIVVKDKKERS